MNICRETLLRLEIDHSNRVSDAATSDLLKLNNLRLLSMAGADQADIILEMKDISSAGCTLSMESLARVLLGLPRLAFLPNGDFLCDCLEWIAYDSSEEIVPKG